jgi:hypothetical protein
VNSKFVKLMMLTTSQNDNEALTALRKANALLAEANVNWEEFINAIERSKPIASGRPPSNRSTNFDDARFTDVHYTDASVIDPLFEAAFRNTSGSGFRRFVDSVHEWWEKNGFLTEKQFSAIKKAAQRNDHRYY